MPSSGQQLQTRAIRLGLELLAIIAGAEIVVMFLLPLVAPGVDGWVEALLDAAMLTCMASPLVVWRARRLLGHNRPADPFNASGSRRSSLVWSVSTFVIGVALAWAGAWGLSVREREASQARFDRAAGQIQLAIEGRFDRAIQGFKGLKSAMSMLGRELTPQEFRTWMAARFAKDDLPGIRGLGFIQRVARGDLVQWVSHEHAIGVTDLAVRTTGTAPDLYVINRIEPLANNRVALGYDIGSEATRRQGIEEAIRTGDVTLTRRIVLVQDGKKRPGFLFFMPLYRPGANVDTAEARRANLMGVIYSPIVVEELLAGIGQEQTGVLNFGVYDSSAISPASLLAGALMGSDDGKKTHLRRQYFLYIGGQPLTLAVEALSTFETTYGRTGPVWVGLLGSVLSAALALTVWLLRSGRSRAEGLADRMTHDLLQATQAAENALREGQALLSTLDQFALVCITAPNGGILYVSDAFCQTSGYTRAELVGQNPRLLTSDQHDAVFWVDVWQTLLHGHPWTGQICNRARDGQTFWVQCVMAPIHGADGAVEKYIQIAYDITEAKRIQDDLASSAERYNLAIDGGSDGLWDWINVHSHEEWWSPQFFRMLGYQPNEIPADLVTFDTMLHPDHQQEAFAALAAAFKDSKPYDVEYMLRTKSGEYRWFRSRAKVYFDEWGSATRMAGSIQDIHDRKMAEATIKEHSEQMGAIFSLSPDGFVSFGADGRVSYTSPAFDALTGMPAQWAVGMDEAAFSERFFQQVAPGQTIRSLNDVRHQAGRVVLEMLPPAKRMLEIRLSRGQGVAVSQVLAFRDVTHESEVDQMKSAFLSMAAHELRTPMASIYGFTELLLTRELKPEKQKDLLGRIYRQSEAMSGIINELLDLARIEARQGKDFSMGEQDLADLVAEVIGDFKAPQGRDAPVVKAPDGDAVAWVDRKKMQQAVLNILSNAYKYSPNGGEVHVRFVSRMQAEQPQWGVEIEDHGLGLSPEQLARVGERFYRADKSGKIPGTGLGVTIVKEIVELMGGAMDLSSELGQGTRVILWVPQLVRPRSAAQPTVMA